MVGTNGRSDGGRARNATYSRTASCLVLAVAMVLCCFVLTPSALAGSTPFTWTGASTTSEAWSLPENWEGGVAPSASTEIGALTFPPLTSTACTVEEEAHPCYLSINDLHGLFAESMTVDGNNYLIGGESITLGKGGLSVSPASGTTVPISDAIFMPFELDATQTWSFASRSGAKIGEDEFFQAGPITGPVSSGLTVELSNEAEPSLDGGIEVGPLTIAGADPGEAGVFNGAFPLRHTDLNSSDGEPVTVSHAFLLGSGATGPLTSNAAEITVGSGAEPAEGIEAPSVKLDSSSSIGFQIAGDGTTAKQDYAQLASSGAIELGGATLEAIVRPPEPHMPCPTLTRGETFTFISTTGRLTGSFDNALESSPELPIRFAESCTSTSQTMRIGYHESGSTQTITGTVEEGAERKEAEAKLNEAHAKQAAEEASAAKKREEEKSSIPSAQGVAGFQAIVPTPVPDAQLATNALEASLSGIVSVKVSCPTGESSCSGTVTLRTLNAVAASLAGAAKSKGSILTLATGSFTVAGGKVTTVKLHLSAKARVLLARSHVLRARATIVAHDPAGASHTTQIVVTLRVAKARRGKA